MSLKLLFAWAAALAAAAPVFAAQPAQAQAQRDWTQVVSPTAEGGFRMGNPNAEVQVVEYISLTCPHCATFAQAGAPSLIRDYVRTGRVSLEYRNFVLNAYDLAAAFLSRCAAPRDYFALNHAILASQAQWLGRIDDLSDDQRRALQDLRPIQGMRRIVTITGLDAIAARHGISAAEARACLSDQAALDRIIEIRRAGEGIGVAGTPSFSINGRVAADVHDWRSLEPLLRAALRSA